MTSSFDGPRAAAALAACAAWSAAGGRARRCTSSPTRVCARSADKRSSSISTSRRRPMRRCSSGCTAAVGRSARRSGCRSAGSSSAATRSRASIFDPRRARASRGRCTRSKRRVRFLRAQASELWLRRDANRHPRRVLGRPPRRARRHDQRRCRSSRARSATTSTCRPKCTRSCRTSARPTCSTILAQSTPLRPRHPRARAQDAARRACPSENEALARLASPVFQVDAHDPPLLLLHGDQDPQMPINQSHELEGAYERAGLDAKLIVVHGAGHGGGAFFDAERTEIVAAFLDEHLRRDARERALAKRDLVRKPGRAREAPLVGADRDVVDARFAPAHQAVVRELPELVAVGPEPALRIDRATRIGSGLRFGGP